MKNIQGDENQDLATQPTESPRPAQGSRLNIELFKKVREKISTTPEAYDQEVYGRPESHAPCGTAACIAGWTCILADAVPMEKVRLANVDEWHKGNPIARELFSDIPAQAAALLGLTDEESEILFTAEPDGTWAGYDDNGDDEYEECWPEPFASQWRESPSRKQHLIAVAYLDHIIETGKVLE